MEVKKWEAEEGGPLPSLEKQHKYYCRRGIEGCGFSDGDSILFISKKRLLEFYLTFAINHYYYRLGIKIKQIHRTEKSKLWLHLVSRAGRLSGGTEQPATHQLPTQILALQLVSCFQIHRGG